MEPELQTSPNICTPNMFPFIFKIIVHLFRSFLYKVQNLILLGCNHQCIIVCKILMCNYLYSRLYKNEKLDKFCSFRICTIHYTRIRIFPFLCSLQHKLVKILHVYIVCIIDYIQGFCFTLKFNF
jgi:hypothetical protein